MHASSRVLVPITYGFGVRYLLPTGLLGALSEVCCPVVGLGWDDPELREHIESLGIEVLRMPDAELTHEYRMYRRRMALVHDRRLQSPTTGIRRRRQFAMMSSARDRAVTRLRLARDSLAVSLPGAAAALEADEPGRVSAGTNVGVFGDLLELGSIDAVLSITPYHDQDALVLWAARTSGVPSLTSVISFDNPTTRERMLIRSERIAVWNHYNAAELLRSYPDLTEDRVEVVGAPQFDLHHRAELLMERDEWCQALDLPVDRPIILYGAGPAHLVPQEAELVRLLDRAIDAGQLPRNPFLLVRRHPTDRPETWQAVGPSLRHGRVVDPWATTGSSAFRGWPSERDSMLQMSSLAHCEVHVNVCSSMTLDGSIFDRPQIGPTFVPGARPSENRRIADMYRQEHWQPIDASGGLASAHEPVSFVTAVADALLYPERNRDGRRRMVLDVLTYDDGRSSERLVGAVRRLLDDA